MITKFQETIARVCGLYNYIHQMQRVHDSVCSSLSAEQKINAELHQHLEEVQANARGLYSETRSQAEKITALEIQLKEQQQATVSMEAEKQHWFDLYDRVNTTVADINAHHEADLKDKDAIIADTEKHLRETQNKLHSMTKRYNTMVSKYNTLTKSLKK